MNLPDDAPIDRLEFIGRASAGRNTYYIIIFEGQQFLCTKTKFRNRQGVGPFKLQDIDDELDSMITDLRMQLHHYREKNRHSDNGRPLTQEDVRLMPWLSLKVMHIIKGEVKDNRIKGITVVGLYAFE